MIKAHKSMTNLEIASLLRAVASAYEIENEEKNRFKIIAYQRAGDAIEHLSSEAKDLWDEGKLTDIPGVGKSISEHLNEIFKTGKSRHFDELMKNIPDGVFELIDLPGIGAKTALKLVESLNISKSKNIISDIEKAAKEDKIAKIEGFGEESQADILETIGEMRRKVKRYLLPYAENLANAVIKWMKNKDYVVEADALGSIRRRASTIGDIDISVATHRPQEALQHFTDYPKVIRVLEKGTRTASIILPGDIQIDLMVQRPAAYGSLLQHFTGSKHHNIALREYALKKGLSLSEYGIKQLKAESSKLKTFKTEEEFYKFLGMGYIEPELREDSGEIEASIKGKLPELLKETDIRSDLQIHSDFNIETSHDLGESSFDEIITKANELKYEYLAFTEHNPSRSQHNDNQVLDILKRKKEAIEKLNYSFVKNQKSRVKKVFNSLEIDIRPDGRLAIPEKALLLLDFALISVHSSFRQSRDEETKRILRAFDYPKVKIFAHPTGRRLNERESVEYNWPEIFEVCLKKEIWLEINADPIRLDLPDFLIKEALAKGIKLTLGTDAHHKDGLDNMRFGVYAARRGWASKENIVNCLSLEEFEKMLE